MLIASYFRELNDYDITNILRQLKELNIISSNDNLLIKNQSDLNRIFQQYKIQYTPFVIQPIVYPPILPLLFQTLTQVFKYNNEDKLLKSDLIKIYSDYKNEHTQDIIESNVYNFIKISYHYSIKKETFILYSIYYKVIQLEKICQIIKLLKT